MLSRSPWSSIYHLFPSFLTGGFVGVDVFLVVSGFLITSHLLAHPPERGRDLLGFWARRIRRLLPASLLVLLVSVVATWLVLPETRWESAARQAASAALYVVNWQLAGDAVDYLAAEQAASPVQHYWSLSVEEQFYFGWPILVLALAALAGVLRSRGISAARVFAAGIGAVVVAVARLVDPPDGDRSGARLLRHDDPGVGARRGRPARGGARGPHVLRAADREGPSGPRLGGFRRDHRRRRDVRRRDAVPGLAGRAAGRGDPRRHRRRRRARALVAGRRRSAVGPCSGSVTSPTRSTCGTGR